MTSKQARKWAAKPEKIKRQRRAQKSFPQLKRETNYLSTLFQSVTYRPQRAETSV